MKKYFYLLSIVLFSSALAAAPVFADTVVSTVTSFQFTHSLALGMTSPDVRELQILLNKSPMTAIAPIPKLGSAGNESAYFGPATLKAVQTFQKIHSLPSTGYVGALTLKALNTALGTPTPVQATATVTTVSPTNAGTTAETLAGHLSDGTLASKNVTGIFFKYGAGSFAAFPNTAAVALPADMTTNAFATTLSGLLPATVYSYEACVVSPGGTSCGESYSFTTPKDTQGACAITSFSAHDSEVSKGGSTTLAWTTTGCASVVLSGGAMNQGVSQNSSLVVGPFTTGTAYTLTAASASGTTAQAVVIPLSGTVVAAGVHAPVISNITAAADTKGVVTIHIMYDGGGEVPSVWFAYGANPTAVTITSSPTSGDTFGGAATIPLSGLAAGDHYLQAFVKNSAGTSASPVIKVAVPTL